MQLSPALTQSPLQNKPAWLRLVVLLALAGSFCAVAAGQRGSFKLANPLPATPPPNSLDANDIMRMHQNKLTKQNFDAVNALRDKQIHDESTKLLILARDLKAQMDLLGDAPPSPRLLREAQVIELLAHDVQTKMTLTVGGS